VVIFVLTEQEGGKLAGDLTRWAPSGVAKRVGHELWREGREGRSSLSLQMGVVSTGVVRGSLTVGMEARKGRCLFAEGRE
jgi:hypothetical protein